MRCSDVLKLVAIAAVLALASFWMAQQAYSWFPPVATEEAKLVDQLFSLLVGLGTFIFLGVSGTIFYKVLTHLTNRFDMSDGPRSKATTRWKLCGRPFQFFWCFSSQDTVPDLQQDGD